MNWAAAFGIIAFTVVGTALVCAHIWVAIQIEDRFGEGAAATYFFGGLLLTLGAIAGLCA